ncbi:MAG: AAA family ATPase [Coriobacteriales bacterium]|jgi:hypothetical protein|nr:AAA family ATPase [Coriobacteriales bacterium]
MTDNPARLFNVATAKSCKDAQLTQGSYLWDDFAASLSEPRRGGTKDGRGYVAGTFSENRRNKANAVSRSMLTLDADNPGASLLGSVRTLLKVAFVLHSTWSHTKNSPRYRLIIPLSRDVSASEYESLADIVMRRLGSEQFDSGSRQPERLMYAPACPKNSDFVYKRTAGDFLNPDEIFAAPSPTPSAKAIKKPSASSDGAIPEGKRNEIMFRQASSDRSKGRPLAAALAAAKITNAEQCEPPLSESEVETIVNGVYTRYPGTTGSNVESWGTLTDQATITEPPALPPFLVKGLLHQGEKMLLTGRAKAGKSLLLSQLALCVATGAEWLGMPCEKTPVLYVLFEGASVFNTDRFFRLKDQMNMATEEGMLITLDLAGENYRLATFTDMLKARVRGRSFGLVIIDPLYMLNGGDENSAEHIRKLFYEIDRIAKHFNASVISCHHQTKGSSSAKNVIDRASGSGVFARFQDVGIDLIELDGSTAAQMMDAKGILLPTGTTAWRVEAYCRNVASPEPLNLWRKGIVWEVDEYGGLDDARPLEAGAVSAVARTEARQAKHDTSIGDALRELSAEGKDPKVTELADFLGVSRSTLDGWLDRTQMFETYRSDGERALRVRQITTYELPAPLKEVGSS